jgi:hypothetical protein
MNKSLAILLAFLMPTGAGVMPSWGQDNVDPQPGPELKPEIDATKLFTRVFPVRPDFLSLGGGGEDAVDDPFAEDDEKGRSKATTAREILEAAGVAFPDRAIVYFGPSASQLIVRNTSANLDLIATFLEEHGPDVLARQIGIIVEYIQLDHGEANRKLREQVAKKGTDANELHHGLVQMIKAGNAKRIGSAYLVTRGGKRAKIESIVEHSYAIEADPPEVPNKLIGPIEAHTKLTTEVSPTTFATEIAGLTLEIDPVLSADRKTLHLNVQAKLVEHLGEKEYGQAEALRSVPVFNRIEDSTGLTLRNGNWALLGIHKPSLPLSGKESESCRAKLVESTLICTLNGQRAKSESVRAWIYPTEWHSADVPQELSGPIAEGADIIAPTSFTTLQTRNVGTTLEVDPVLNAIPAVVDIGLMPEIVNYFGDEVHGRGASAMRKPIFATMKFVTAITARSGEPVLVSMQMPLDRTSHKPDASKRVFFFLTASMQGVE